MSLDSRIDRGTPESIFQALAAGIYGEEGSLKRQLDKLDSEEQHIFFDTLLRLSHKMADGDTAEHSGGTAAIYSANASKFVDALYSLTPEALRSLRSSLGPWYSAAILADCCCVARMHPSLEANRTSAEGLLRQRMKTLAEEVLAWAPGGVFSQIVLSLRNEKKGRSVDEKGQLIFLSCIPAIDNANEILKAVNEATKNYVTQQGSSSELRVHYREDARSNANELAEHRLFDAVLCKPVSTSLLADDLPIEMQRTGTKIEDKTDKRHKTAFLDAVIKPHFGSNHNYCVIHVASGIDTVSGYGKNGSLSTVTSHAYLAIKVNEEGGVPVLCRPHLDMMEVMLHKLAHHYSHLQLEERAIRLGKHETMLRLLSQPLARLTDAISNVQAETQEIRSILEDPQEAIFAVQKQLAPYFEEGRVVTNPDGSRTKISHNLDYVNRRNDAYWILVHILTTIRGGVVRHEPGASSEALLGIELYLLEQSIKNWASQNHELSKSTLYLLGGADTNGSIGPSTIFSEALEDPSKTLRRLKSNLFTPFKPDATADGLDPDVIRAFFPNIKFTKIEAIPADTPGLLFKANPLATHGQLIRFMTALAAAANRRESDPRLEGSISREDVRISAVKEIENEMWGQFDELKKVIRRAITRWKDGTRSLGELGNYFGAFTRLIERMPEEVCANPDGGPPDQLWLDIASEQGELCIRVEKRSFSVSVKARGTAPKTFSDAKEATPKSVACVSVSADSDAAKDWSTKPKLTTVYWYDHHSVYDGENHVPYLTGLKAALTHLGKDEESFAICQPMITIDDGFERSSDRVLVFFHSTSDVANRFLESVNNKHQDKIKNNSIKVFLISSEYSDGEAFYGFAERIRSPFFEWWRTDIEHNSPSELANAWFGE